MKKRDWMANRGSITVFLMLMMPIFVFLVIIIVDISEFNYQYRSFIRKNYLIIESKMDEYNLNLFNRYGLFAVEKTDDRVQLSGSLSENELLKKSIVELMQYRIVNDVSIGVIRKAISNRNVNDIINIYYKIDEIIQLKNAINMKINNNEIPNINQLSKLAQLIFEYGVFFDYPYNSIDDIFNLNFVSGELIKIEIKDEIKKMQYEYFELFDSLKNNYIFETIALSEYILDYMGYSSNLNKKKTFTTEYVLTGFTNNFYQRIAVQSEIGVIRLLMNTSSILMDTQRMKKYLLDSGGDLKLQLISILFDATLMSILDVELISKGKAVPLFKSPKDLDQLVYKEGLYYKDYLRILLVVMPEMIQLQRTKECIEYSQNINLDDYYLNIEREAYFRYDFKLWEKNIEKTPVFKGSFL